MNGLAAKWWPSPPETDGHYLYRNQTPFIDGLSLAIVPGESPQFLALLSRYANGQTKCCRMLVENAQSASVAQLTAKLTRLSACSAYSG